MNLKYHEYDSLTVDATSDHAMLSSSSTQALVVRILYI
jgi:hypothetical protein